MVDVTEIEAYIVQRLTPLCDPVPVEGYPGDVTAYVREASYSARGAVLVAVPGGEARAGHEGAAVFAHDLQATLLAPGLRTGPREGIYGLLKVVTEALDEHSFTVEEEPFTAYAARYRAVGYRAEGVWEYAVTFRVLPDMQAPLGAL